jgi:hypothetical protein
MIDLYSLMNELSSERPLFHSEADFQFSLSQVLARRYPTAKIRLEVPRYLQDKKAEIDIFVNINGKRIAIELKYGTSTLEVRQFEEEFQITSQCAEDQFRYKVCMDIQRLEALIYEGFIDEGFFIVLSNEKSMWEPWPTPRSKGAKYDAFRIHEGKTLNGTLAWSDDSSEAIDLRYTYSFKWLEYSRINEEPRSRFRFAVIAVNGSAPC